ncbi:hypothetical protein M569_05452, partial [Genlisea aurea]
SGGGWGGWGFSPLSYLSDLQKSVTVAAEEISRNAVEAAKVAAKHIVETIDEESKASAKESDDPSAVEEEINDEDSERRKASLDKLEKASQETLLSHGLKVIDTSVESLTSGAWQALGTAWKGIENSASNLAESIQHGSGTPRSNAPPSLLETGKAITAKGLQVLEQVGKETMDLLVSEAGVYMGKKTGSKLGDDQLFEDITFDRCFYIYGGPEQLEELEALSNHYVLLYNRRKAKLSSEQKTIYEGKLKDVQNIFDLGSEFDETAAESDKGKKIDAASDDDSLIEWKKVHDSSVRKAAELAAGFASALSGLAPNDVLQRTSGRLDALHSEGIHRLSEMCCLGVTQLLTFGRSLISESTAEAEGCVEMAKILRTKTQSMTGNMESVFNSFVTGL